MLEKATVLGFELGEDFEVDEDLTGDVRMGGSGLSLVVCEGRERCFSIASSLRSTLLNLDCIAATA